MSENIRQLNQSIVQEASTASSCSSPKILDDSKENKFSKSTNPGSVKMNKKILVVCTTDSMIFNFLIPHIKDLEEMGNEVYCACSKTGDFLENLRRQGLKVYQVDFERNPYNLKNLRAYKQLDILIKKLRIDIVFCHEPVGGAMGRIAGYFNKCKVIYMAHGFHFYKGAPKSYLIYYIVEKILSYYTDLLITINDEDYKVSKTFYAKKNIKLNGIGIDISKFIPSHNKNYLQKEFNLEKDSIIILSVGELINRKNHITVIKSLLTLPSNYHYVIVGEGELFKYLSEQIGFYGLKNRVHLLGYRSDVLEICNSSDIFIMPSIQEGLSVALMEAMACGLPVVASNIRGNIDLIDKGKGGFLVEPTDSQEYADAILTIINNKLNKAFGNYNRKIVKNYDINQVRIQIKKVFEFK